MTAGCNFACYKSNLQFHLSCAFISPPPIYFRIPLFFFSFQISRKLFWNTFNTRKKKHSIHSPLISSWVSEHIYSNPLRQILHRLCTPLSRRAENTPPSLSAPRKSATRLEASSAFMQIHPTSETCAPDLAEPGKWLTSHLYATEREACGLIWEGVWQAGEHSRGCIRLTLPHTSLIY